MRYLFILSIVSILAFGAPAFSQPFTFKQSDGSTFIGKLKGDEYLHWVENEKGDVLLLNKKSRNFEYAIIKEGRLSPSGIKPGAKARSTVPAISKEVLKELWRKNRAEALEARGH